MSILLEPSTPVLVQGITGSQARVDAELCRRYGTRIVAGVTPGRGGEEAAGVPVYDTVAEAVARHGVEASLIYVPPLEAKNAVLEAVEAGVRLLVAMAERVPRHDLAVAVTAARRAGARLVGFNTNGFFSSGKVRMGGIGGLDPDAIYAPGRIGVCSRSGGMCAEIGLALKRAGMGVSTVVAMGGDMITGMPMADYVRLFDTDPETDAIVLFGEPGTDNEQQVAAYLRAHGIKKPVVALVVGTFQERYPPGISFGHAAAMIQDEGDSASAKKKALREAGVMIAETLRDVPELLEQATGQPRFGSRRDLP